MKKNLFSMWLMFLAILFSVNMEAQITVGGKKAPESFSVLELLNKGGLRLPQMTTAQRNAFSVQNNAEGEGLTIYNITTNCVEYWNKTRWVSMCDGTSQTVITPQPCINVAADGTGCDDTFAVSDVDCPNGPFVISIVAGGDYAVLSDVDNTNGTFKISFGPNNSINTRTVLVRVTSTCTSMYKEFLFSQNGINCSSMNYTVPAVTPSNAALSLCTGGAVYLSVPAGTKDLDKLIWTRNGIEVARGVSYIVATQKGKYNVSMGAIGCNTSAANERVITESGTAATTYTTIIASNNGELCGTNTVTLTASGSAGTIAWFHKGVEVKDGRTATLSGDGDLGEWFAAIKDGSCYSKPSNTVVIIKSTATGQVAVNAADVLVNGQPLTGFTSFCQGGTLDLSVANPTNGISYTWYNGNDVIVTNPFVIPGSQTKISLRLVAADNTGTNCPKEVSVIDKDVTSGNAPAQPNITGNAILCDGTTDLTLVPGVAGTYTYTWYMNNVKLPDTTPTITVSTPGAVISGTVTNASGCVSPVAVKTIAVNVSSLPVLSWITKPGTATFGAKVTLQTSIEFGPASTYEWTADNGAVITGTGASATVQLPASGTDGTEVKIKVTGINSCGKSIELEQTIVMNKVCPTPSITTQYATSQNITAAPSATAKVGISVSSGVGTTYQWYSNTTNSNTDGTVISGATKASYAAPMTAEGTYYFYCIAMNSCNGTPTAVSPVFKIVAAPYPGDLPPGSGTFGGRACFDIAESNNTAQCGLLGGRTATKADFNLSAVNTQVYTFKPTGGTVQNVRFAYVESLSGQIIKSLTPSGNTATVLYQSTLSSGNGVQGTAYGKTADNALTADIYAIYFDGSKDVQVRLRAQIKDCNCCGANIAPGVWRSFMCHNLGADQTLNPFIPAKGLMGSRYRWGTTAPGQPANKINSWGPEATKGPTDPCPAGYRLPTKKELEGLISTTVPVQIDNSNGYVDPNMSVGYKFGDFLMLPGTGVDNGIYNTSDTAPFYWTSTFIAPYPYSTMKTLGPWLVRVANPDDGMAIRCISEY